MGQSASAHPVWGMLVPWCTHGLHVEAIHACVPGGLCHVAGVL